MKTKITLALLTLKFSVFNSIAQQKEAVKWLTFEQLSDSLAIQPKNVLLFFHTDWCVYCRKMMNESFTDGDVIKKINDSYYAVAFDAESIDTVSFDGQILINEVQRKEVGKYHDIAKILASKNQKLVFPTSIILDHEFIVKHRFFQYLDKKKLIKVL